MGTVEHDDKKKDLYLRMVLRLAMILRMILEMA